MEPIIDIKDYLKRKLREVGPARWEAIAKDAEVKPSLPRKVAYENRNFGIETVQPLLNYFLEVDRGERTLPWDRIEAQRDEKAGA